MWIFAIRHWQQGSKGGCSPPGRLGQEERLAMNGPWELAAGMAPSGALAWGWAMSRLGLVACIAGALAGAIMGVLGGWLMAYHLKRVEQSERKWHGRLIVILTLC